MDEQEVPWRRPHGKPFDLIRPVAIVRGFITSVDDALAAGVWEGACENPVGCSLQTRHGTKPDASIDLNFICRCCTSPEAHLGYGTSMYCKRRVCRCRVQDLPSHVIRDWCLGSYAFQIVRKCGQRDLHTVVARFL